MATVWKMKARSGTVGARGVGPLLRELREQSRAGLHSMLLLQAAVNRWCFAAEVADKGVAGGYHRVPEQVETPVVATLSARDRPLHDLFHLVMHSSLGEPEIAAIGRPDRYGALGGYGPAGLGAATTTVPMVAAGKRYEALDVGCEVLALDGTATISGHGDVSNRSTWWALHCLTTEGQVRQWDSRS